MTRTVISLSNRHPKALPEAFQSDDVRYCPEFVEHFLGEYTCAGDVVLDPFMGFGTTLVVSEKIGRIGYGVEFDRMRCEYVKSQLEHPERALQGDSLRLFEIDIPAIDFSITSPPYMGKHHTENPFTAYSTIGKGYDQYLKDLQGIYKQIADKLKPGGHAVIEVSNLKHPDAEITLLAWDIAREVSNVLNFIGETIISWEPTYSYGYDHSYALVFSKPGTSGHGE